MEFPVSTYYAVKKRKRQPSLREVRDEQLKEQIMRVWENRRKGRGLYGARKVWLQLRRDGIEVARCTVERLMRGMGLFGVAAGRKKPRTTVRMLVGSGLLTAGTGLHRAGAEPPLGRRYHLCGHSCGFVYTAFVTDLFSRKIVGWQVADHLRAGWRWTHWRWRSSPPRRHR